MTNIDYTLIIFFGLLILFAIFEGIKSFFVAIIQAWKRPSYNTEYIHDLANIYIELKILKRK